MLEMSLLICNRSSLRGVDPREATKQSSVYVTLLGILWIASSFLLAKTVLGAEIYAEIVI